jgi:hypothetical protein
MAAYVWSARRRRVGLRVSVGLGADVGEDGEDAAVALGVARQVELGEDARNMAL